MKRCGYCSGSLGKYAMDRVAYVFWFLYLIMVVTASCNQGGLIVNAPPKIEKPKYVANIEPDSSFSQRGLDSLNAVDLQLVSDSVLVIRRRTNDASPYLFSAYSVGSFRHLGSFLSLGRGPGEALQPYIADCGIESGCLNISDSSLRCAWQIDVLGSINSGKSVLLHTTPLPDNMVDWVPITDTLQLVLQLEQKQLLHQFLDSNGRIKTGLNLFEGIDAERYITQLSSVLTSNTKVGEMASFMVCFPQVYILDAKSQQWKSIAVDNRIRKWKQLLKEPFTMEKDQYYIAATSSSEYIIASYNGYSLEKVMRGGYGSEIHIFDWRGDFLYKLTTPKEISAMTFDHKSNHLYCIEQSTGKILRYDLSTFLNITRK